MVLTDCANPWSFANQVSPGKSSEFPQRSCQLRVLFRIQTSGATASLLAVRPVTKGNLSWLSRWLCSDTFRSRPTGRRCGPVFCRRTCSCSQLTSCQLLHFTAWLSQFVHIAWVSIAPASTVTVLMLLWEWGRCCGCDHFAVFCLWMYPFTRRLQNHLRAACSKTLAATAEIICLSLDTRLGPYGWLWLELSRW